MYGILPYTTRDSHFRVCRKLNWEPKAPLSLIEQVEKVNTERKIAMAGRIEAAAGGTMRNKTIGVLGATFKPIADDMREAPSLVIIPMVKARAARIRAYDPQGRAKSEGFAGWRRVVRGALEAAEAADLLVVLTEWNEFRALDLKRVREAMLGNFLRTSRLRKLQGLGWRPRIFLEDGLASTRP